MAIVFVTGNNHKFQGVQSVLEPLGISVWQKKMDLFELESDSPSEIALGKARHAFSRLKMPLIAEDTSIFFEAYNNFPGTQPKRIFEQFGYEGLFNKLKGRTRQAYFHTALCFMDYHDTYKIFEAQLPGMITRDVVLPEADRMPYEKIFVPEGKEHALVQLSMQEKNVISHRAKAAKQLAKFLVEKDMGMHEPEPKNTPKLTF